MSVTFLTNEDKSAIDKELDNLSKNKVNSSGHTANKFLGTDENGNVVEKDPSAAGTDGVSPTVSISKSGKTTTITITDKDGPHTATITDGEDGEDGKTPVNGTDYWTAEDQESIIQRVIEELGAIPVFGRVDENNDIILTALLEDGVYTLKYVDANGNTTVIGTLEHNNVPAEPEGPVEIPLTWAHGSVLDKSTGKVTSTTDTKYSASDFVGVNPNKAYTLTRESAMYNTCNVVCYDADNNFVSYITLDMPSLNASTASNTPVLSKQFTVPANAAKIRLRLWYEDTEDAATVAAMYKLIEE